MKEKKECKVEFRYANEKDVGLIFSFIISFPNRRTIEKPRSSAD